MKGLHVNALRLMEASRQWSDEIRDGVVTAIMNHPRSSEYLCLWQIPEGKDLSHFNGAEGVAYREGLVDASADLDWMIAFANYDRDSDLKKILERFGVWEEDLQDCNARENAHLN